MGQRCSGLLSNPLAAGSHSLITVALLFKAGDERSTRAIAGQHFFRINQQSSPTEFSNYRRNAVAIPLALKRSFHKNFISRLESRAST